VSDGQPERLHVSLLLGPFEELNVAHGCNSCQPLLLWAHVLTMMRASHQAALSAHYAMAGLNHFSTLCNGSPQPFQHTMQWQPSTISAHYAMAGLNRFSTLCNGRPQPFQHTMQWKASTISAHYAMAGLNHFSTLCNGRPQPARPCMSAGVQIALAPS